MQDDFLAEALSRSGLAPPGSAEAHRERYARTMRAAEEVVRVAEQGKTRDPDEAIRRFEQAVRRGEVPDRFTRDEGDDGEQGETHREYLDAWREFSNQLAEHFGDVDPSELVRLLNEEFAEEDPANRIEERSRRRSDSAGEFKSWMNRVARHAQRHGATGEDIAEALGEAENETRRRHKGDPR